MVQSILSNESNPVKSIATNYLRFENLDENQWPSGLSKLGLFQAVVEDVIEYSAANV